MHNVLLFCFISLNCNFTQMKSIWRFSEFSCDTTNDHYVLISMLKAIALVKSKEKDTFDAALQFRVIDTEFAHSWRSFYRLQLECWKQSLVFGCGFTVCSCTIEQIQRIAEFQVFGWWKMNVCSVIHRKNEPKQNSTILICIILILGRDSQLISHAKEFTKAKLFFERSKESQRKIGQPSNLFI